MPAKRRSNSKKTKKAKSGAEPMPSLIFNTVQLDEQKKEDAVDSRQVFPGNHGTKKYMWGGVIAISGIIFFLWGFAMIAKISHFSIGGTPEGQLAASAKNDWDQMFEKTKTEEMKKQALDRLKNIIGQMIVSTNPSSTPKNSTTDDDALSTASTTISMATTTPTSTITTTTKKIKN
ncbi:MAG: hypothetical protein ABII98_01585 [bacterium]